MANTIKVKRSAVPSKVPATTDLELGELAVNTYDGKLFLKKDDGTPAIVQIGGGGGSGDVVGPASATDNALTRYDGTTGKLIQNSVVTVDDSGNMAGVPTITDINYIDFNTGYATTLGAGQLGWDGNDTLGLGMIGGNVIQHIGEDQFFYCKASSAITKGQVVMFTGAVGASGVPTGAPATGITDGTYIMGVAAEAIALNGFGLVQSFGTLRNVNTSGYADGDILWYNPSVAGGLTSTKPSAPNVKAQIAAVINGGSSGGGTILIRINAGSVLGGTDSNVQFGTLSSGDLMRYNGTYWTNVATIGNSNLQYSSITINGSAISLGGSVSVGTVTSVAALTLGTTGTDLSSTVATGTTTPVITLNVPTASASNRGALSSTDWSTFNGKQAAYTNLTTIGALANGTGWLYNNGSGTFSYSTPTKSDVGLGNVTNNAQTQAAVVPNTAPSAGQILVGNAGGTAYAPVSMSGDATLASTGAATLATVNSNVGSFTYASITVDAKGRITAASSGASPSAFPAGTAMLFVQTSAPTGWTKSTTHDNKALRIVSGAASSGGSVAFTTAFASKSVSGSNSNTTATNQNTTATGTIGGSFTVGATTLATTQIPSHTHGGVLTNNYINTYQYGVSQGGNPSYGAYVYTFGSTGGAGGGTSHTHSISGSPTFTGTAHTHTQDAHTHTFTGTAINLAVSYVDAIIATKD